MLSIYIYTVTINSSQGQTLRVVEVWLEEPIVTHGQLYVTATRVGDPRHLHFVVSESVNRKTRNVVYKEFLQTGEVVTTQTEVPLTCSFLNSSQQRDGVEK